MKQAGFSLIELLLYTALVLLVMPLAFGSLASFVCQLVKVQQEQQCLIGDSLVIDVVRRDMVSVCAVQKIKGDWYFKQSYLAVDGGKVEQWICWRGTARGATRWCGMLDFAHKRLVKKQTQCFAESLQTLMCEPVFLQGSRFSGVAVTYHYGKKLRKTIFSLRTMQWQV